MSHPSDAPVPVSPPGPAGADGPDDVAARQARWRAVRWVGFDVDGVLTDAGVWLGEAGELGVELKRFDIRDGLGLVLLKRAGLSVAFVSARPSPASARRAAELGIPLHETPRAAKVAVISRLLAEQGLSWEQAAFVGDDLVDVPVLRRVAVAAAPADAVREARDAAGHVLEARGGAGAVREFVEWFLRARGEWDDVVGGYLAALEASA